MDDHASVFITTPNLEYLAKAIQYLTPRGYIQQDKVKKIAKNYEVLLIKNPYTMNIIREEKTKMRIDKDRVNDFLTIYYSREQEPTVAPGVDKTVIPIDYNGNYLQWYHQVIKQLA